MTPAANANTAVILERIEALRCDVVELKNTLGEFIGAYNQFRVDYEKRHAELRNGVDAAHARIDVQEKKVDELKDNMIVIDKTVKPLVFGMRIVSFIAGAVGLSVLALIWSILTHQVGLTF